MPLVESSTYRAPVLLRWSGHACTVYPFLFRQIPHMPYVRQRVDTPDGDFLDIDWLDRGAKRVAVLIHGMEGCSRTRYMRGMAQAMHQAGWDVAALNLRGCSGEANRTLRLYHSGATEDLDVMLQAILPRASSVVLIGFSIGGNLILKYLGERGAQVDSRIHAAVTFSVPCDLASTVERLDWPSNILYRTDFTMTMRRKLRAKPELAPLLRSMLGGGACAFDRLYVAPYHGFASVQEYYRTSSSGRYLADIALPVLLISAQDDPMLAEASYPVATARTHRWLHLEMPRHGGHIGFAAFNRYGRYWSELRTLEFLHQVLGS